MLSPRPILSESAKKELQRACEDLESAVARQGLTVVAIHDVLPDEPGRRVYEVCHEALVREALARSPEAAPILPCRIVVSEEGGGTRLTALSPEAQLAALPELEDLARRLEEVLLRALREAVR